MNDTKITISISPSGATKIKVDGAKGKSCSDLTKALESALGETTTDRKTSEYYEVPDVKTVARQR